MSENEPLQRIELMLGHVIIGQVIDGHVHVTDIIHEGISEVALTGETPDLHPISVGVIEGIRRKKGLNGPIEAVAAPVTLSLKE